MTSLVETGARNASGWRVWRAGGVALGAALAANLLLFVVGRSAGAELLVTPSGSATITVTAGAIALVTALTVLSGTALTAIVFRRLPRAALATGTAAITVTVLSLAGPLLAESTSGAKVVLASMHLVTGASFAWLVGRSVKRAP